MAAFFRVKFFKSICGGFDGPGLGLSAGVAAFFIKGSRVLVPSAFGVSL
jgi:hypothetical protein